MSAFVFITYFTKTKGREVALQIVPLFETKLFPFPMPSGGNKARGSLLSDKWPQTAPSGGDYCLRLSSYFFADPCILCSARS